ncbi:ALP1-like protein [Tanacetum coccineum]
MAPIRSNKGKRKVSFNDNIEIWSLGQSSGGQRVVFSKNIAVLVSPANNADNFEALFKVSKNTFNYIRSLVRDHMMSRPIRFRFQDCKEMSLNDQIAIALRRLSSVNPTENIAYIFGTNEQTVFDITWWFAEALRACGHNHISWPTEMAPIKSNFEKAGGMPNCCGAIETAYLKMHPHDSECDTTVWLDSEKKDSMTLQVIVDPRMLFVDVIIGWPGSVTKDAVLVKSEIHRLAQKGKRLDVSKMKLCEGTELREYLVGGFGFQLRPWLITSYQKKEMSEVEIEFNKRHLRTRLVANQALNKLKNVWAAIDGMWSPDRNMLPEIIFACCLLHNIVITMEGDGTLDDIMVSSEPCASDGEK